MCTENATTDKNYTKLQPSDGGSGNFKVLAKSQEEEDAFDYVQFRRDVKGTSVTGSVAHMIKGALGAGVLSGHVAYQQIGLGVAVPLTVVFGVYMCYCLYTLVASAQVLYKRTRVCSMSYSDVGEAALACYPNPSLAKYAKCFRILIDVTISIDLFGSCACYQIIIAKSIKQLVENVTETKLEGQFPGYPGLRVYLAAMIIPIILICFIRYLKYLAPFSVVANAIVAVCIMMAIYYAFVNNPHFENLVMYTQFVRLFRFIGMNVFSMSCAGVVIPVENNMKEPKKFPLALAIGMFFVVACTFAVSFFGYVAYREESRTPITVNFPMTTLPMIIKALIVVMIFVTHALNFWVPFNISYYYIKKRINPDKHITYEYVYRAVFVLIISLVAICFPQIDALIGFIGTLCLSNMAFIWPNVIGTLVISLRPGYGKFKWRLWRNIFLTIIGFIILVCGTIVNGHSLFFN